MNKKQILTTTVGILTLVTGIFAVRLIWFSSEVQSPQAYNIPGKDTRVSGPYTHKNLTVFLIHGADVLKGRTPLALEEALERRVVVLHETGNIEELAIDNVSRIEEVYVQAGDIVKGGQQDRVLAVDLIVPARSQRLPIGSFCVENNRWTRRGPEPTDVFTSSAEYISSKNLKVAARIDESQGLVWNEVEAVQEKLSVATNSDAKSDLSDSSLQLTLENSRVREDSIDYINALSAIVEDKHDVIGFIFTLNGEINSAETYGSTALFLKLWPKLLKASAIEALAESDGEDNKKQPSFMDIRDFLDASENAAVREEREVTSRIRTLIRETKDSVFLETLDRGTFLHGSYYAK